MWDMNFPWFVQLTRTFHLFNFSTINFMQDIFLVRDSVVKIQLRVHLSHKYPKNVVAHICSTDTTRLTILP